MAGADQPPRDAQGHGDGAQALLHRRQKLESIATLARGVAHEINNPVQAIMNYAQLIKRRGVSTEVDGYAAEILHEAQRIASIIRNLLAFSRQAGEPYTEVPAREVVDGVLALLRAMLESDGIRVEVQVPSDLILARCHPQQVQQVLHNLLTNARDALLERRRAGGPAHDVISIRAEQMRNDAGSWARMTVEDHGVGMAKDMQEKAFDPFFTTKNDRPGAGLGLSIAHGIVVEHGGAISIESALGQWTRVHVDLPTR